MATSSAAPAAVEDMMQLVTYDEQFASQFEPYLERVGLASLGFDYHTVSVMGAQSSGKSTLLNLLFHTGFREMDAAAGRSQTTQGVWAGRDPQAPILLLDLEGTDSRERGEEAATFERKSSLFALALSEVLVINLWAQDVGRFNAANLALLRTVLELDLQLFSAGVASTANATAGGGPPTTRNHKTRLLFVLRDHAMTPLELLASTLRDDVANIWATISKPAAAANLSLDTFFDLDFVALPHKVFCETDFLAAVADLRSRFHDGSLFLPAYRRGVAADGLAPYAGSVWETIRANKELDIPSQQHMLAHVRCESIASDAYAEYETATADVRAKLAPSPVGGGGGGGGKGPAGRRAIVTPVPRLLPVLGDASDASLITYDGQACRYASDVASSRRDELVAKLVSATKPLVAAQAAGAAAAAKADLEAATSRTKDDPAPWAKYAADAVAAREAALATFDAALGAEEAASAGPVLSFVPLAVSEAREALVADLDGALEAGTADVRGRLSKSMVDAFGERVKAPLTAVLDAASTASSGASVSVSSTNSSSASVTGGGDSDGAPAVDATGLWARVSDVAAAAWTATAADAGPALGADGLGLLPAEADEAVATTLRPDCVKRLLADVRDAVGSVSTLELRVTKRFDDGFRFDARGVPRTFAPGEDIEAAYLAALTAAEALLTTLSVTHLTGAVTDGTPLVEPLVAPAERAAVSERLRRAASAVYVEARRSQEAARVRTTIPWWVFLMLAAFGSNEAMWVLRNPALLLLAVIAAPIAYVMYAGGGVAPLLALLPATVAPAVRAAVAPLVAHLRAALDNVAPPPPAAGGSAASPLAPPSPPRPAGYGAVGGAPSEVTTASGSSTNGVAAAAM